MSAPRITLEVLGDEESFLALRPEWDTLYDAHPDALASQSFEWRWQCWLNIAKPRGRRLHIAVARQNGRIALIWPVVLQKRGLWTFLRPLSTESTDYAAPLIADIPSADALAAEVWRRIRAWRGIDVIRVQFAPEGAPLHEAIERAHGFAHIHDDITMRVSWVGFPTWDDYYRSLSNRRMSNIRRCRKRLEEKGALTSQPVSTRAELQEIVHWILAQKRLWRERKHQTGGEWIERADYEACLEAIAADRAAHPLLSGWALRLDGVLVAALVMRVGAKRLEPFIFAYDREYASYGPGEILFLDALKQAFELGQTFDFRIGAETYKTHFNADTSRVTSYDCALTPLGYLFVALKRARAAAKRETGRLKAGVEKTSVMQPALHAAPLTIPNSK